MYIQPDSAVLIQAFSKQMYPASHGHNEDFEPGLKQRRYKNWLQGKKTNSLGKKQKHLALTDG